MLIIRTRRKLYEKELFRFTDVIKFKEYYKTINIANIILGLVSSIVYIRDLIAN